MNLIKTKITKKQVNFSIKINSLKYIRIRLHIFIKFVFFEYFHSIKFFFEKMVFTFIIFLLI